MTARRRSSGHVLKAMFFVTAAAACGAACIIPDKEIDVVDARFSNRFAVRLLEPTLLSAQAAEAADIACDASNLSMEDECPQPGADPALTLPHFLDNRLPEYNFCSCEAGATDSQALGQFTLYVEDQDEERTREPDDDIYAALLLDLDPADPKPHRSVAYADYLDPKEPLGLAAFRLAPLLRRNPHLRQLTLGFETFDLCNGAYAKPLEYGYHTLKVMVTDRAWFKHVVEAEEDTGQEVGQEITHVGVPDLAAGATYDSITYVFHCSTREHEDQEGNKSDNCSLRCSDPNSDSGAVPL